MLLKKGISIVLVLAVVLLSLPLVGTLTFSANWEDVLSYRTINGGIEIEITGCGWGASGELVIPGEIDGLPVTSIGDWAFEDCSSLTSITIPNSVTSIGDSTFGYCSSLTSITIPDSVTSIGDEAFAFCSSLTSITIPDGVASIGDWAFYGCSSLTSFAIPDSVTSIGDFAFESCSSLASVTIPDSVTSIGNGTFAFCSSLTSITIPNSVTSIGYGMFSYCSSLENVIIGNSVTSIGDEAFSICSSLESINVNANNPNYSSLDGVLFNKNETVLIRYPEGKTAEFYIIPDSVTSIGDRVFYNCSSLTGITIPGSVTSIGDNAFAFCSSLTSITIPNSVTSIGYSAFDNCSSLTSVTIPDSVTSIGDSTFAFCSSLTSITMPDGVTSIGEYAFYYCSSLTSVTIPDSVTSIEDNAFAFCSSLTSVTIPDSVTSIEDNAFAFCSSLTSITIPNSVTSIGYMAFYNCSSLTSVTIPDSVTSIGDSTFAFCSSLTSITMPDGVTSIGEYAFYYCSSLTSVTIPDSVTSIGYVAFYDTAYYNNEANWEDDVLYIGNHLIKADYINGSYTIKPGTKCIAGYAFEGCSSLESIIIPDSVTSIGDWAFWGCSSFTSITIPDSVTSIGDMAFYDTAYYNNEANWEDDVLYIGNHLIKADYINGSYTIKPGTKCIADDAFSNCSSLESVTIPDSVTSIGDEAFSICSSLESINVNANNPNYSSLDGVLFNKNETVLIRYPEGKTAEFYIIPDSVTSIGDRVFYNCSSLTSVTIPDSVTSIGDWAFSFCRSVKSIFIPSSVGSIGKHALGYISDEFEDIALNPEFKLYCYEDSAAQDYAVENDVAYELVLPLQTVDNSLFTIDDSNRVIISPHTGVTIESLFAQLLNENIAVYRNGVEISGNEPVGTGCEIELIYPGGAYHSAQIVILGDVNGDSVVDAADLFLANKVVNAHGTLEGAYYTAANLDETTPGITIEDYQIIENLALGKS